MVGFSAWGLGVGEAVEVGFSTAGAWAVSGVAVSPGIRSSGVWVGVGWWVACGDLGRRGVDVGAGMIKLQASEASSITDNQRKRRFLINLIVSPLP